MPTVAEVLKQAGLDETAIAAIDAKAVTAFDTVLSTAQQEREKGEVAQRTANQLFEQQITPALNQWGNKQANLEAERDYYKKLAEGAKNGGFITELPPFQAQQPRDGNGQYVPNNAGTVPGAPNADELRQQLGSAFGTLSDLNWKYRSLFDGKEMPDSPSQLDREAQMQRLPLTDYVARKYDFAGREKSIAELKQKEHDDAVRKTAAEERDKYWAERTGSNPNTRPAQPSRYADVRKAVADGTQKDPVKMTPQERKAATRETISRDLATQTVQ